MGLERLHGSMWWFLEDISLGDSLFPADSSPRASPFLAMVTVKLLRLCVITLLVQARGS